MPYTVNRTNSSAEPGQYTVADSVINTETDLSLIGKGYAGYGEAIAENFLHLLELILCHVPIFLLANNFQGNFSPGSFFLNGAMSE